MAGCIYWGRVISSYLVKRVENSQKVSVLITQVVVSIENRGLEIGGHRPIFSHFLTTVLLFRNPKKGIENAMFRKQLKTTKNN